MVDSIGCSAGLLTTPCSAPNERTNCSAVPAGTSFLGPSVGTCWLANITLVYQHTNGIQEN